MSIWVQKFGGTSVGSVERIKHVAGIIAKAARQGQQIVVVVSAMNGETTRLMQLGREMAKSPHPREYDALLATGEQVSASLLAMCLQEMGLSACSYTGLQLPILTSNTHMRAQITEVALDKLNKALAAGRIPVITGFQGVTLDGDITTLGRGGSDITAVALAAALQASECQIYTDVDGVYSCDPRLVANARKLPCISMQAMLEMASAGAKVMQYHAMQLASKLNIPLRILSSFTQGEGTLISSQVDDIESASLSSATDVPTQVTGIAVALGQSCAYFQKVQDAQLLTDLLRAASADNIQLDFMYTTSERARDANLQADCCCVSYNDKPIMLGLLSSVENTSSGLGELLESDDHLAKLSIVGFNLEAATQLQHQAERLLEDGNIRIYATSRTPWRISWLIESACVEFVAKQLHRYFIEAPAKMRGLNG